MSENLVLHLKREYFEQIKSGFKTIEYRRLCPYWLKRMLTTGPNIQPRHKYVHFYCGYPPKGTLPLIRQIENIVLNKETGQIEIHLKKTVEQGKFETFYSSGVEYCDCGSSTCDICNPGWDEEVFDEDLDSELF